MTDKTFKLTDPATGKVADLPIREGTIGPATVDIGSLYKGHGVFTYDPGFMSTASCSSAITYIDGEEGILLYRGYPVDQLAAHSSFIEVSYLLLNGELPTKQELEEFTHTIQYHTMIKETLKYFFRGFHHDAHPMAMMAGVVGSLAAFYHDRMDPTNPEHRALAATRLIAKIPTIAAACYRHHMGWPTAYPLNRLGYCERFLHMMFSVPAEDYEVSPVAARALDLLPRLPASKERDMLELEILETTCQQVNSNSFSAAFAGREALAMYTRAIEIARVLS